jgi:hypothetical protein
MWGNKKPDTPQAADPEPKNLQMNQPPKPAPAYLEGTTKMNKDVMRPAGATADRATARLGSSLHLKGEISGNEDLDIDGTVEGAVQLGEGKLTVGATANVTADIIAREVVVWGKVKGNNNLRYRRRSAGSMTCPLWEETLPMAPHSTATRAPGSATSVRIATTPIAQKNFSILLDTHILREQARDEVSPFEARLPLRAQFL